MATKNNPGAYDCYANAAPDEPMFVLLGRDNTAPQVIRFWCQERIRVGKNKPGDPQITEALECARTMERFNAEKEKV